MSDSYSCIGSRCCGLASANSCSPKTSINPEDNCRFLLCTSFNPLSSYSSTLKRRAHLAVLRHSQDQHRFSPPTNLNNPLPVHQDPSGRLLKAIALSIIRMNWRVLNRVPLKLFSSQPKISGLQKSRHRNIHVSI